jgi:hypothetical protein
MARPPQGRRFPWASEISERGDSILAEIDLDAEAIRDLIIRGVVT